jgi:hypothetical protein
MLAPTPCAPVTFSIGPPSWAVTPAARARASVRWSLSITCGSCSDGIFGTRQGTEIHLQFILCLGSTR